jgi:transposase
MTQSRTLPAGDVMRSRMMLLLADGVPYQKIQDLLDTTAPTIARWKRRFLQHRIVGLMEELHPGQQPSVRTPKLQAKVLVCDPGGTEGWLHALVVSKTGGPFSRQQRHHSTDFGASRCPSAPAGTLYG